MICSQRSKSSVRHLVHLWSNSRHYSKKSALHLTRDLGSQLISVQISHIHMCIYGNGIHKLILYGQIVSIYPLDLEKRNPPPQAIHHKVYQDCILIAKFLRPTWSPSRAKVTQVGPMLAPRTLLSGYARFGSGNSRLMLPLLCSNRRKLMS